MMDIQAKLMINGSCCDYIQLQFPMPIEQPLARHFRIWWGGHPETVKAVSKLSATLYEIHLEPKPRFPMSGGAKYESFPDDQLAKIRIKYEGRIRCDLDGQVLLDQLDFHMEL